MGTKALIEAFLAAQADLATAQTQAQQAAQSLKAAQDACKAAESTLHDDLAATGPRLYIDETATPPTYTIFAAVDPDQVTATPIELAA